MNGYTKHEMVRAYANQADERADDMTLSRAERRASKAAAKEMHTLANRLEAAHLAIKDLRTSVPSAHARRRTAL